MKTILTTLIILLSFLSFSQTGAYLSLGYGLNYGKGDLTGIKNSYTSYKLYSKQTHTNDSFEDNGNWKEVQTSPTLSITAGYQIENLLFDMSYHRSIFSQEKELIRQSGYGRNYLWKEKRHEVLVNVGRRIGKLAFIAGLGSNFTNFTMASYQVYPDGSKSINNEYSFNGLFKGSDVGFSYSLALKYYIFDYLHAELRYIYSTDKLIGGSDEFLSIYDFTNARDPITNEFPLDYNKPLNFENSVLVGVNRSYLLFTIALELNSSFK